jgi:Fe-S-cluster-containing hydrogenase component 2
MLACPFGMIFVDAEKGFAVKCDLCGGDPECVKYCIPEALRFEEPSDFIRSRAKRIFDLVEEEILTGKA